MQPVGWPPKDAMQVISPQQPAHPLPPLLIYDENDFPQLISKRLGELALELATEWKQEQQQLLDAKKREIDALLGQVAELRRLNADRHMSSAKSANISASQPPAYTSQKSSEVHNGLPGQAGQSVESAFQSTNSDEWDNRGSSPSQMPVEEENSDKVNDFQMLDTWKKMSNSPSTVWDNIGTQSQLGRMSLYACGEEQDLQPSHPQYKKKNFFNKYIWLEPHNTKRTIWDTMAMFLVLYDIVRIPLELFNPPAHFFTTFMAWLVRLYWTLDIPMNLITGFIRNDGRTETSANLIIRRYMCTWALTDVLLVCSDWSEVIVTEIVSSEIDLARLGKTARVNRIFRALRLVRLVRILRISETFRQIAQSVVSELYVVIFDILMLVLLVMGLAHIIGCIWYGIGDWESRHDDSRWVYAAGLSQASLSYKYFVSLHWAVAQFSGGMDEFRPFNIEERVFAIFSLLTGIIVLSICVSGLTSAMTRLLLISSGPSRQVARLRQYLFERHISAELTLRILRTSRFILKQQERCMGEDNIELIKLLSEPLRMELHYETRSPTLTSHFFFNHYNQKCPYGMRSICHHATSEKAVSAGDLIFSFGECPRRPHMIFVRDGRLRYQQEAHKITMVDTGHWVSEGVLWTNWSHRGTLSAISECDLLVLDSAAFQDIVSQFQVVSFEPANYAKEFVHRLNYSLSEDISDLEHSYEKVGHRLAFRATKRVSKFAHAAMSLGGLGLSSQETSRGGEAPGFCSILGGQQPQAK